MMLTDDELKLLVAAVLGIARKHAHDPMDTFHRCYWCEESLHRHKDNCLIVRLDKLYDKVKGS